MSDQISIAALREDRGLTQEALASKLGVTAKAVSGWENSKVAVKPMHVFALAYVFKISADKIRI